MMLRMRSTVNFSSDGRTCMKQRSQLCGSISRAHAFVRVMGSTVIQIHKYINFIYVEIQCRLRKLILYRKRDYQAKNKTRSRTEI